MEGNLDTDVKVSVKDTRSVSWYPYNRSILQYVEYTKLINIAKWIVSFRDELYFLDKKGKTHNNKTKKSNIKPLLTEPKPNTLC